MNWENFFKLFITYYSTYLTYKVKGLPVNAAPKIAHRFSSMTSLNRVLARNLSTRPEPKTGTWKFGTKRRANRHRDTPKRLKRNEMVKKTPPSYIDVTVTWRRITDSCACGRRLSHGNYVPNAHAQRFSNPFSWRTLSK